VSPALPSSVRKSAYVIVRAKAKGNTQNIMTFAHKNLCFPNVAPQRKDQKALMRITETEAAPLPQLVEAWSTGLSAPWEASRLVELTLDLWAPLSDRFWQ
jgi:hypothetical protein